jgi:protoheme ferro-lyase
MESGGETYKFIPCLNGDKNLIDFLEILIKAHEKEKIDFRDLL